jgi:hypothetical protein
MKTGIEGIDKLLAGGLGEQELAVVMGSTNKNENVVSKRFQIQFEIQQLLCQVNSIFGSINNIQPTEEQQLEMYNKIADLRGQLMNL